MAIKGLKTHSLFSAFVLLLLFSIPALGASAGKIDGLSGAVYLKQKDSAKWEVASKGAAINVGDRVKTGSDGRALLKFSDSSKLTIGNLSEIEVSAFLLKKKERSATYSVSTGKVRAIIGAFSGSTDIKVKTPTGVAGVKGTDFMLMNQGSANVLFGRQDSVEVSGDNAGPVTLGPGEMTENTRGGGPIAPVRVEPGSALDEARAELEAVTTVDAPVEWEKAGQIPNLLGRWNINYGHYLADSQRFREALDVFQIAVDLTDIPGMRAEAHLERGTVFSRNLNEQKKALDEYMAVVKSYQVEPFLENALFSAGMINMDLGEKSAALELFRKYLADYPQGAHRETVEQLIRVLETE